jgi:hypothetical protein
LIALVHLVWGPLGPQPLRRFIASYKAHPAGVEHELVVLLNGTKPEASEMLLAELRDVDHRVLTLAQPVQDLAAYRAAAERLEHSQICFLNSYSVILAPAWLGHLALALDQPQAGLVGATGSWASVRSAALNSLFLPNPYRRALPKRSVAARELRAVEAELATESQGGHAQPNRSSNASQAAPSLWERVSATVRGLGAMPGQIVRFPSFPSYHLRTNGFIVDRRLFLSLRTRPLEAKTDAYVMESGYGSFTGQVLGQGLRALVVTRDGHAYDHDEWQRSRTLWQGDQENLMIADNQTRIYANGGIERRRLLAAFAWGAEADARPPARAGDGAEARHV